jgi:hypothetical protein
MEINPYGRDFDRWLRRPHGRTLVDTPARRCKAKADSEKAKCDTLLQVIYSARILSSTKRLSIARSNWPSVSPAAFILPTYGIESFRQDPRA